MQLALLVAAEQTVLYVLGLTVNRMSDTFAGQGKTDSRHARVIADTARMRRDLAEFSTPDELLDVPRVSWSRLARFQATGWVVWCSSSNSIGGRIPRAE